MIFFSISSEFAGFCLNNMRFKYLRLTMTDGLRLGGPDDNKLKLPLPI